MSEQSPTGDTERHPLPPSLLHDLRTPLNQIIGYSEMLLEQAQEQGHPDLLADLQKTHAAGKQLLELLNDNFESAFVPRTETASANQREKGRDAETASPKLAAHESASGATQGVVLVVDDVVANRDVLSRQLKRLGYAVALAENGQAALDRLRANDVDLVLLDIMMPEMDGYEVLQRLKADPALHHIPVIMISALHELESVVRCIELGAEDYLPKPFNPTLLKARLGASLDKKRARDREQELAAALRAQNTEMAAWRKAQEADLAIARTTQQAIVTSALPPPEGWEVETLYTPLIQVGGDVYGWRQLENGSALFWVADATGHGIAAALFTTLVALLFNHASSGSHTAHGILARVNAEFYSVLRGRSFMTAGCAVIETNGRLSFAGAGHPPLLLRRRGGAVETVPSLATMIGIHPGMEGAETVTTLAPGDAALLYTDGLYSSRSDSGERLTGDHLTKEFARLGGHGDLLARLVAELAQSKTEAFDDDIAAIALRRV